MIRQALSCKVSRKSVVTWFKVKKKKEKKNKKIKRIKRWREFIQTQLRVTNSPRTLWSRFWYTCAFGNLCCMRRTLTTLLHASLPNSTRFVKNNLVPELFDFLFFFWFSMKHNKCVKKEIPRETTRGILRKYIRYVHVVFYLFYLLIYIIKTINFTLPWYISDLDLSNNSTIDSKGLFNPSQSVSLVLFDTADSGCSLAFLNPW